MPTIKRSELVRFVDRSAAHAGLDPETHQALIDVAESTDKVAHGDCDFEGCGCPAVQAGLWGKGVSPDEKIAEFARIFDHFTAPYIDNKSFAVDRLDVLDD